VSHARTSLADLGDGVFRKIRRELGITAFGANAMVLPPGDGGLCHVEAHTPRWFGNAGDTDLVLLVIGAHDGYAGRDGNMVDPADEERRRAVAEGGPLPALIPQPGKPPDRPR
jgi:hypothetical protein